MTETLEIQYPIDPDKYLRRHLVGLAKTLGVEHPPSARKQEIADLLNAAGPPDQNQVQETAPYPFQRTKDKVVIVGFAPTWNQAPWDDEEADLWGMNALYKLAPDKNWAAWFQLHDVARHHPHDLDEHMDFLRQGDFVTFMWDKELEKFPLPKGVAYPREQILEMFGASPYFTNTVSWMIALAIMMGYKHIGIYGIDMAQDSEYGSQRPSCEYFIGLARGMGIEVFVPETSDLLKSPFLYGYDDPTVLRIKLEGRLKELSERRNEAQRQRDEAQAGFLQLTGAIEDVQYLLKNWVHEDRISS